MKCDELKVHKAYNRWIVEEMPTPNDDLICNEVYLKDEVDAAIAELKQNLEDAKATAYAESVDAGMENSRMKRALWLARARNARNTKAYENLDNYTSNHQSRNSRWNYISSQRYDCWFYAWEKVERKCLKKAEEYK